MGLAYSSESDFAAVAVDAVTPVLAFTTRTARSLGVRIKNPLAVVLYVREIPHGGSAPSFANMATNRINDAELQPGDIYESGAREYIDVYLCCASGTGSAQAKEIF